ncbi:MAG: extracellular solute-binding protein [Clostridiales bacterium]
MKKFFLLILLTIYSLTIFTGCNSETSKSKIESKESSKNSKSKNGSIDTEIPEIEYCFTAPIFSGGATDPELDKKMVEKIEKEIGVRIKPKRLPKAEYKERLARLLASGDAPDIYTVQQAMKFLPSYVVQGNILSIDKYIQKSKIVNDKINGLFDLLKVDGETYHIPTSNLKVKSLFLRQDLVEEYGINLSQTPTTEEFYTEMKKAIGKGSIPITLSKWIDNFQFFYNSFGGYGDIHQKDGIFIDGFNTPEVKSALEYIVKLYKEGIIDKEFINVENSVMRENLSTKKAASSLDYYYNYLFYINTSKVAEKPTDFTAIYKLIGPNNNGGGLNEAIQDADVISTSCKNPDAAYKYLEWSLLTEKGRLLSIAGLENSHYTLDDNKKIIPSDSAINSNYTVDSVLSQIVSSIPKISNPGFKFEDHLEKAMDKQNLITNDSAKYAGPNFSVPAGKSPLYDNLILEIKEKRESIARNIAVGNQSIEDGFNEYTEYWESINGEEILKELNK